jgi:hypothetical protein
MGRRNIDIGSSANDGTGDTLRNAGQKINDTLVELYLKLGGDSDNLSSQLSFGTDGIIFEGSSADDFETTIKVTNPTADQTITFPNTTGSVIIDGATQTLTNKTLKTLSYSSATQSVTGNVDSDATLIICNGGSAFTLTLGDGSTIGEYKIFTNKNTGLVTIDPVNFRGAEDGFSLSIYGSTQCIWDGSNWFLLGSADANNNLVSLVA